ncbi:hypothetical protein [Streptomonospora wellingtoniae]|uniref:Uncharacterized protein n=1 Tax=Streptomonospora wellingtoniae TaxID=3075544 RepID=A0ABU2KUS8_9ACTN|nr:hypothetical protein [Streptomonospora sp. DSM 45055]MDT0302917.1 hypothetical protein [Streptomonospora sp. DSM 45055]
MSGEQKRFAHHSAAKLGDLALAALDAGDVARAQVYSQLAQARAAKDLQSSWEAGWESLSESAATVKEAVSKLRRDLNGFG